MFHYELGLLKAQQFFMVSVFNCSRENRFITSIPVQNKLTVNYTYASQSATVRLSKMYNKAAHRKILKELKDYVILHIKRVDWWQVDQYWK